MKWTLFILCLSFSFPLLCGEFFPKKSANLILRLEHALWILEKKQPDRLLDQYLTLEAEILEAKLPKDALGYACFWEGLLLEREGYNKADHFWRITSQDIVDGELHVEARLRVSRDMWGTGGGRGLYRLQLQREQERITGSFTGRYNGREVQGKVTGSVTDLWPRRMVNHQPLQPREHPRLVFRASDVHELRERAKTPEGQLIVQRLKKVLAKSDEDIEKETCGYEAAGQAFLYTLTGDQAYADRSQEIVARIVGEGYIRGSGRGGNLWRETGVKRILTAAPGVGVALAYDLCYHAWPEAFRDRITVELEQKARRLIVGVGRQEYNDNPSSNHYAICNGAGGLAALAIFDEPGPYPDPPLDPTVLIEVLPVIVQGGDAASSDLIPGELPFNWVWAGPWKPESMDVNFAEALGGRSQARPEEGTRIIWKDQQRNFEPLPKKGLVHNKYTHDKRALNLIDLIDREYNSTVILYTVLRNKEERLLRYRCEHGGTRAFLTGQELKDGQGMRLVPGSYPLFLHVGVGKTNDWGLIWARPRFEPLMEEELAEARQIYELELEEWEEGLVAYEARGGSRPLANELLTLSTAHMKRHLEMSYGDHGWYNEGNGYKRYALRQGAFPFLQAYANVMGREFVSEDRLDWIPLEWISKAVIRPNSLTLPLYGPGERQWTTGFTSGDFSLGMGVMPERDLGMARWLFDRRYGREGDQSYDISRPHHAIFALVNYPFEVAPQHPSERLPRAQRDVYHGGYVFRKQWKNDQDILATITTKERPLPGWNFFDAGSFRIMGYGSQWAWRGTKGVEGKSGHREHENVVQVEGVRGAYGAQTVSWKGEEDGAGGVRMKLIHPYFGKQKGPEKIPEDFGIRGERSFAVCYDSASGTDAVFVVQDLLEGRDAATWTMHTGVEGFKAHPDGFTLSNEKGNTLRAHFITESPLNITKEGGRIQVTGAAEYLVVMTLNPGKAPDVFTKGSPKDATGRVGRLQLKVKKGSLNLIPDESVEVSDDRRSSFIVSHTPPVIMKSGQNLLRSTHAVSNRP